MDKSRFLVAVVAGQIAVTARLPALRLKRQMIAEYDCYVQSVESRMAALKAFLTVIDSENDVLWERLDAHRWACRSYFTKVADSALAG